MRAPSTISREPRRKHRRGQAGHWEADLMLFRTYGQAVLVVHERRSRLIWIRRQPSKATAAVQSSLPPAIHGINACFTIGHAVGRERRLQRN